MCREREAGVGRFSRLGEQTISNADHRLRLLRTASFRLNRRLGVPGFRWSVLQRPLAGIAFKNSQCRRFRLSTSHGSFSPTCVKLENLSLGRKGRRCLDFRLNLTQSNLPPPNFAEIRAPGDTRYPAQILPENDPPSPNARSSSVARGDSTNCSAHLRLASCSGDSVRAGLLP